MGQWIRTNWWIVLGAVLGLVMTVGGILLPFEDRTLGSVVGGIAIALLGVSSLAGIAVRRRYRILGDFMIAAPALPTFLFFWTIWLPILGLAVLIPAMRDVADASAVGEPDGQARPA